MGEQVLHRLFEGWALRQPAAPALSSGGGTVSYGALDTRVRCLAARLRSAGLVAGQPVLVLAGRGADLVTAQLAVSRAGGAFVCVPPDHPAGRLTTIVTAAPPGAVVVDAAAGASHRDLLADLLPGVPVVPAVPAVSAGAGAGADRDPAKACDLPPVAVAPDALAYVAFTSGSTGRPKGIPHRHRTLAQFVGWQGEAFGIGPGARVAQLAPPGFDVSYCETFGALCRGASLHVPPEATRGDAALLAAWLADERVTLVQVVPAHWRALLAELPDDTTLPDLATVLFVGEALAPSLVAETRERLGGARAAPRLVNVYGPTEVVAATFHEVGDVDPAERSVPIGRPIPGREIELDDGEIVVRSPHLSAGYLGGDPIGGVYRTGDRARRLPGGELQFVGRVDNQVKLRGQRVELEDVEAAIVGSGDLGSPGAGAPQAVDEAVATVRAGHDGAQLLVAFVVPPGRAFDPEALRRRLAGTLPPYMVPNVVVAVDRLPRNANGKVDRSVVAGWDVEGAARPASSGLGDDAPVGEVEEVIAGIWCELLDRRAVGRHADLFTLGGDSLLATRIVSRVRARLGVRVTLGAFFDDPTVAGLASAAASAPAARMPALRGRATS